MGSSGIETIALPCVMTILVGFCPVTEFYAPSWILSWSRAAYFGMTRGTMNREEEGGYFRADSYPRNFSGALSFFVVRTQLPSSKRYAAMEPASL